MPSSIILVVKYSLQHCIQNLCPHSRPVKYCNDKKKQHKGSLYHVDSLHHFALRGAVRLCHISHPPHRTPDATIYFRIAKAALVTLSKPGFNPQASSKERCG